MSDYISSELTAIFITGTETRRKAYNGFPGHELECLTMDAGTPATIGRLCGPMTLRLRGENPGM
jgi:hypothetical protein